jgi:hypothetical protein
MATVRLYDHNLSGFIEFVTDDTPEEIQEKIDSVAGLWTYLPGANGRVLLSDEWHANYYIGTPDEFDPYPDYRLTGSGHSEFA